MQKLSFEKIRQGLNARLNALLNQPIPQSLNIDTRIDTQRFQLPDLELLLASTTKQEKLQAAMARIRKNESMKILAQKNYLPDFKFQGTYITIPQGTSTFIDDGKNPYSFQVEMNIPIWLGQRHAAVNEAEEISERQSAQL